MATTSANYIEAEKEDATFADGFVPNPKDWEKDANWSDIIVFDDTSGQGAKLRPFAPRQACHRRHSLRGPPRRRSFFRQNS